MGKKWRDPTTDWELGCLSKCVAIASQTAKVSNWWVFVDWDWMAAKDDDEVVCFGLERKGVFPTLPSQPV